MKRWWSLWTFRVLVIFIIISQSIAKDAQFINEDASAAVVLSFSEQPSYSVVITAGQQINVTAANQEYRFLVTVRKMVITGACDAGGDDDPFLEIDGGNTVVSVCENFFSPTMSPKHMYEMTGPLIIKSSNWKEGDRASIYVSIYYESDTCDTCKYNGDFCCTGCSETVTETDIIYGNSASDAFFKEINFVNSNRPRCIPKIFECNHQRECGHSCADDEDPFYCSGMYGWNMSVVWTTLLAVVFFVITPAAIVFLVCYNSHLNVLRRNRRAREDSGTMEDPPNDLPPAYEDVEAPPPCFCTIDTSGTTGTDNPAFEADTSPTAPHAQTCTCIKGTP